MSIILWWPAAPPPTQTFTYVASGGITLGGAAISEYSGYRRVTQQAVEALLLPDTPSARLTQESVEALLLPDAPSARVTQIVVEVLVLVTARPRSQAFILG